MKKAFTLIELIAVVVVLGFITLFSVPTITKIIKNNDTKKYEKYLENIYMATENYIYNTDSLKEYLTENEVVFVSINDLVANGFLSADMINPNNNTEIVLSDSIKVTYDENKLLKYEYLEGNGALSGYVTDGLILHYDGYHIPKLNGSSSIWEDLSNSENNGTLLGFDSTSGWNTNYIYFDGVDDYVISSNNLGISGDSNLTMCAVASWEGDSWLSGWSSYMGINYGDINKGLCMAISNAGQISMDFWDNRYLSNPSLNLKQTYHICVVKQLGAINTASKIYFNGTEIVGTGNSSATPNIVDSKAVVGRLDSERWANAKIYSAMFYNKALTQEEISQNYEISKTRFNLE